MSDTRRQLHNVTKLALMGVIGVVSISALVFVILWPMLLWWQFGQPLSVAIAVTITWVAAIQ